MKLSEANRLRLLYFLVFSCTASWLPIFAEYLHDRGLTGIQISAVLNVTPVMMFLVQPFSGMLADRLGYKRSLRVASILTSLAFTLYLLHGDFVYLLIITAFMSLFYNTAQPLLDSLSLNLAQRNPSFSYGTLRIAGALGWASTGTIVGYNIDALGTTVIFVFASASMLLTFFVSFSLTSEETTGRQSQSFKDLKKIVSNKALVFLLMCVLLISACTTTIWNFYSIYMKENGASASLVGYGLSLQGLCELPLFYFSARIISSLGMRTTLLVTVFATGLRMLLYGLIKNPYAAVMIELLHGISWSLFWVVCVAYVDKLVREDWRATGQSLLYAAYFGIGAIAGNFWTGYLYHKNVKVADIFLLNAVMVFLVGLLIWIFMRKVKSATSTQTLQI